MKYKTTTYTLVLICVFSFLWFYLSRNYLFELDGLGIQGMIYLTSAYAGYNSIMSHGSIYSMMFIFVLQEFVPKDSIQILIRMKRKSYVFFLYRRTLIVTLRYVAVFLGVMIVLTILFQNWQMLCDTDFLLGAVILFIYLILYYFFIGSIFCFFKLTITSNAKSIFGTIIISIVLLCLRLFRHIWTPVAIMDVFDLLMNNSLFLEDICINIFSIVALIISLYFITTYLFNDKDVLNEEK